MYLIYHKFYCSKNSWLSGLCKQPHKMSGILSNDIHTTQWMGVKHQLATVTLSDVRSCCAKCCTSSQMPNALMCRPFTAAAVVVPLLMLTNTVDRFLCTEFQTVGCFRRCSIHCVNVVGFPVLMFYLNKHVNNMWRNRKTFLKWCSIALLLADEDFLHFSEFHIHTYSEHCMKRVCAHFTHSVWTSALRGTVPCILNFVIGYVLITNCFHQYYSLTKPLSPIMESTTCVTHINGLMTIHTVLWKHIFSIISLSMCGAVRSLTWWLVPLF